MNYICIQNVFYVPKFTIYNCMHYSYIVLSRISPGSLTIPTNQYKTRYTITHIVAPHLILINMWLDVDFLLLLGYSLMVVYDTCFDETMCLMCLIHVCFLQAQAHPGTRHYVLRAASRMSQCQTSCRPPHPPGPW